MSTPRRPIASPRVIPGTTIRRSYVAPKPADLPRLGDIVDWAGHRWDVVGLSMLGAPAADGRPVLQLQLERIERPSGRKKRVIREHAPSAAVVILGRQVLLPGMPAPTVEAPPRPEDVT